MLPRKNYPHHAPAIVRCPLDHLHMDFQSKLNAYRCNLPGCRVAYSTDHGYFLVSSNGNPAASLQSHVPLYAQAAICLCENDETHPLYIEDYVATRRVRFWVCPVHSCRYEVSQRLEKTDVGWRTCGSFEQSTPIRIRH
jgi:hypothetical protein